MADPPTTTETRKLRANAIGIVAAATLGIVFMSPALAFYGNWGPVAATVGSPTPLVFLIAALVIAPTTLSYAFVANRLPSAGSSYTFIGRGLNRHLGDWTGFAVVSFYILILFTPSTLFGLFFNAFLNDIGIHVSPTNYGTYALGVILCFAVAATLAFPGIQSSSRAATIIVSFEVLVILALATFVLAKHTGQLSFKPFNPGSGGLSSNSFWLVMPIAFYSYVGFDVVSTAAEETHLARRAIPRATIAAVVIFCVFLVYSVYAMGYAVPSAKVAGLVSSGITPIIPIANQYWGSARWLISLTGCTAGMGATLAILVGTSRVMFAMARDGALTPALGRLHPRYRTPWTAMSVLLVIGLLYDLIAGKVMGGLLAYFWAGTAVAFFALITYALVNAANITLHWKHATFNWWWHVVTPVAGIVFCLAVLYKSFVQSLWNAGWVTIGRGILVFAVVWSLVGVAYAYVVRNKATMPTFEGDNEDLDGRPITSVAVEGQGRVADEP
jgi:amino acid transporter